MLTIFSTAKPFRGHAEITQRNALKSWILLHPDCEVILFGNEPGTHEVAAELGIGHLPEVLRSEQGTVRLDYIFARAQEVARHDLLCYANCDIIFPQPFYKAAARVAAWSPKFLMVGRRWDTPVIRPLDFETSDWETRLRDLAVRSGKQQLPYAVDYFVFPRGLYSQVPPLAIGRSYWDHWLVWKARSMKVPVVDASADVFAIHQNHDFSHHPGGLEGVRLGPEARRNRALAGGQWHLYTIEHATHQLVDGSIKNKPGRWHVPITSLLRIYSSQFWYWFLRATLNARHALGLYQGVFSHVRRRVRSIIGE